MLRLYLIIYPIISYYIPIQIKPPTSFPLFPDVQREFHAASSINSGTSHRSLGRKRNAEAVRPKASAGNAEFMGKDGI